MPTTTLWTTPPETSKSNPRDVIGSSNGKDLVGSLHEDDNPCVVLGYN